MVREAEPVAVENPKSGVIHLKQKRRFESHHTRTVCGWEYQLVNPYPKHKLAYEEDFGENLKDLKEYINCTQCRDTYCFAALFSGVLSHSEEESYKKWQEKSSYETSTSERSEERPSYPMIDTLLGSPYYEADATTRLGMSLVLSGEWILYLRVDGQLCWVPKRAIDHTDINFELTDLDVTDYYCQHRVFVGNPYGRDLLCLFCEER